MPTFNLPVKVFSTYVEVILRADRKIDSIYSILHVCGGDPKQAFNIFGPFRILHVCGGDPLGFDDSWAKKAVFSTYVEVILETPKETISLVSILHVCGGDPWLMRKLMN